MKNHFFPLLLTLLSSICVTGAPTRDVKHLLYVASPGTRNYTEYGGVGILVFDIDNGYRFVRRIPTWDVPEGKKVENVKGIVASAKTGRVYVSSLDHVIAIDAVTGAKLWDKAYEGVCDRLAISPDGKTLYVPQLQGPAWHVVDAERGDVTATIRPTPARTTRFIQQMALTLTSPVSSPPVFQWLTRKRARFQAPYGHLRMSSALLRSMGATLWFL